MKKSVLVVLLVICVAVLGCSKEPPKTLVSEQNAPKVEWNAFDEVEASVAKVHASGSIVTTPSGNLLDEINKDSKKILVALVVAEARRGWPGLNKSEELDLVSEARCHSFDALENLKLVIRRNANKAIAEAGHNPKKENWDNNNCSTAILFCYWPKAEQKGKEAQFLREYISGQRDRWTAMLSD